MPSSFIAKITERGGPAPDLELDSLVRIAEERDDGSDTVWFATRVPGVDLQIVDGSRVLIIAPVRDGEPIEAVFAVVKERRDTPPNDPVAKELYEGHAGLQGWWRLESPMRLKFKSLEDIPGLHATTENQAIQTFGGQTTFAYWNLPLTMEQVGTPEARDERVENVIELPPVGPQQVVSPPGHVERIAGSAPPAARTQTQPDPSSQGTCFYGVDFSGGREINGRNSKIWIAKWDTGANTLTLECGADQPGFRRTDLPAKIAKNPGWWVIDFPFGIPTPIARLQNYNHHTQWWNACADAVSGGQEATALRDQIRDVVRNAGEQWSRRRGVDTQHETTWFPLFEQLYRQTVHGAGEVLASLHNEPSVAILPWDANAINDSVTSFVSEGFPGITLRSRLGLPATGYKGKTTLHAGNREMILDRLATLLLITEDVRRRAVDDSEGDAVDAILLVVAARNSCEFGIAEWQKQLNCLGEQGLEGWFPA
ncbi:MAG: hypothetical protein WCJ31_12450 [Planctomycetia bacterium]